MIPNKKNGGRDFYEIRVRVCKHSCNVYVYFEILSTMIRMCTICKYAGRLNRVGWWWRRHEYSAGYHRNVRKSIVILPKKNTHTRSLVFATPTHCTTVSGSFDGWNATVWKWHSKTSVRLPCIVDYSIVYEKSTTGHTESATSAQETKCINVFNDERKWRAKAEVNAPCSAMPYPVIISY